MPRLSSFSSPLAYSRRVVAPKIANTLAWDVVADDSNNSSATPLSYEILTVNDAKSIYVNNPSSVPDPVTWDYLNGRYYLFKTPNLPGVYAVSITATNSAGSGSGNITINCSTNPNLEAPVLADSIVTISTGSVRAYLFNLYNTVTYTGGHGFTKRYSIANLPATLELSDIDVYGEVYGYISNPSQLTLQCTRVGPGGSSTANLLVIAQTINPSVSVPVISIPTSPTVTVSTAFTYQITATNSPTAYYSTALPVGLSLNATTGVISGTYNGGVGEYRARISANNAGGSSEVANFYLNLAAYVGWALNSSSPTGTYNQVAMNLTGTQQAAVISSSIYVSSDSGATWASKLSGGSYVGVAIAGNGNTILAVRTGPVRVSNDFGETWADVAGGLPQDGSFTAAAMSSNGVVRTAVQSSGRVYRSIDSGVTWSQGSPPLSSWVGVAMSSNGSVQTVISNTNLLYTSSSSGSSWTSRTISGMTFELFHSIAMSSTGANQTLLTDQYILTSSDSGATWTNRYTAPSGYNFSYGTVRMSSDGSKQYVAANQRIYKSTDYGVTWTVDNAPVAVYGGLALSSDATKGIAASRLAVGNTGRAYKLFV